MWTIEIKMKMQKRIKQINFAGKSESFIFSLLYCQEYHWYGLSGICDKNDMEPSFEYPKNKQLS